MDSDRDGGCSRDVCYKVGMVPVGVIYTDGVLSGGRRTWHDRV